MRRQSMPMPITSSWIRVISLTDLEDHPVFRCTDTREAIGYHWRYPGSMVPVVHWVLGHRPGFACRPRSYYACPLFRRGEPSAIVFAHPQFAWPTVFFMRVSELISYDRACGVEVSPTVLAGAVCKLRLCRCVSHGFTHVLSGANYVVVSG